MIRRIEQSLGLVIAQGRGLAFVGFDPRRLTPCTLMARLTTALSSWLASIDTRGKPLCAVRENIADLRAAATPISCANQHAAIRSLCSTLFRRLISAPELKMLMAEADAKLPSWQGPKK